MRVVLICISLCAWASIFLSAYVRFDQLFPLLYTKQAGPVVPLFAAMLCYSYEEMSAWLGSGRLTSSCSGALCRS